MFSISDTSRALPRFIDPQYVPESWRRTRLRNATVHNTLEGKRAIEKERDRDRVQFLVKNNAKEEFACFGS